MLLVSFLFLFSCRKYKTSILRRNEVGEMLVLFLDNISGSWYSVCQKWRKGKVCEPAKIWCLYQVVGKTLRRGNSTRLSRCYACYNWPFPLVRAGKAPYLTICSVRRCPLGQCQLNESPKLPFHITLVFIAPRLRKIFQNGSFLLLNDCPPCFLPMGACLKHQFKLVHLTKIRCSPGCFKVAEIDRPSLGKKSNSIITLYWLCSEI